MRTKLSLEDLSTPYATVFHVFLAGLRQSCHSQLTCFGSPPLKTPSPAVPAHLSMKVQTGYTEFSVRNNLWEEGRGKHRAEKGHMEVQGAAGPSFLKV